MYPEIEATSVITRTTWLWLLMVVCVTFGLLVMGIWVKWNVVVVGNGILLPTEAEVIPILSLSAGQLTAVLVKPNQVVTAGQVLAIMHNPYLQTDLHYAYRFYQQQYHIWQAEQKDLQQQTKALQQHYAWQSHLLLEKYQHQQTIIVLLAAQLVKKQQLYRLQLLTNPEWLAANVALNTAKEHGQQLGNDLLVLTHACQEKLAQLQKNRQLYKKNLLAAQHVLALKRLSYQNSQLMISPNSGIILNQLAAIGEQVQTGKPILTLLSAKSVSHLEAIVFVSAHEAKNITPGMQAQLLPLHLDHRQFKPIFGVVTQLSAFPASKELAYRYLGNQDLVENYFMNGAPFMVHINIADKKQDHAAIGTPLIARILCKRSSAISP